MKSPFKFLDAYTQEDIAVFFGREEDTEKLYNALTGVKHLLVYGPSGAGKTSLIECGLRNQFSDADWYALTIRKGKNINESVFTEINKALRNKLSQDETLDFSELVENLFAERYQPVYLLFDQFEELLILGEKEEKETFFTSINQLIRYKVPCRILFIMREEFIGHLSEFEPLCPSLFQNRYRLEKMNRSNVQTVIQDILDAPSYQTAFNVQESESLTQKILSKLPDPKKEIELAHVQVFLSELWDKAKEKAPQNTLPVLQENLIEADDNLETILDSFLKKQLSKMEKQFGEKIPLEVLAVMISERHTKLQLSDKEIQGELKEKSLSIDKQPLSKILNLFERSRILRKLGSDENIKYEITHDVLASAVGQNLTKEMKLREKAKDIYKVYQEREGFFSQEDLDYMRPYQAYRIYPVELEKRIRESADYIERRKREEVEKQKAILEKERKLREKAEAQRLMAEKEKQKAEAQRQLAEKSQKDAEQAHEKAEAQRLMAEKEKQKAEAQRQLAEKSQKDAEQAQEEAEAQRLMAEKEKQKAEEQRLLAEKSQKAAEQAQQMAEMQRQKAQKRSQIAVMIAAFAIIALGIALWQYYEAKESKKSATLEKDKAITAKVVADTAKAQAERSGRKAQLQKDSAVMATKKADSLATVARKEKENALTSAKLADEQKQVAEKSLRQFHQAEYESMKKKIEAYRSVGKATIAAQQEQLVAAYYQQHQKYLTK